MTSRPRSNPTFLILVGLAVLGATLLLSTAAHGQAVVRLGTGSASISMPVTLTVPPRLTVGLLTGERVLQRTSEFTEVELGISVAANLAWTLNVAVGATTELGVVLLRSADGDWVPLGVAVPQPAASGLEPMNPTEVKLRLRLPAGMDTTDALRLRLSLVPADVAGL